MATRPPKLRCKGCGVALDTKRRGQAGMPLSHHLAGNIHCCREYLELEGHVWTFPAVDVPVILDSLHYERLHNRPSTVVAVKGVTILGATIEFDRCRKYTEAAEIVLQMKAQGRGECEYQPTTPATLFSREERLMEYKLEHDSDCDCEHCDERQHPEEVWGKAACIDCGRAYSEFGVDLTLPDDQWKLIHPGDDGLLCASCIARRAAQLPGIIALRCRLDIATQSKVSEQP